MSTSTDLHHAACIVGLTGLLGAGSLLAVADPTFAATLDLSSWSAIGDTVTTVQPTTGAQVDLLSGFNNFAFPDGTISGSPAASSASLSSFLSALIPGKTGSAIKSSLTVNAGDTFNFSYDFNAGSGTNNDAAFLAVNGALIPFATTAGATGPSNAPGFFSGSQAGNYSYTFSTAGTYDVGLGIFSSGSTGAGGSLGSGLGIAGASVEPVPEPSTILGLLGFGAFGAVKRFRKKQTQQ